MGFDAQIFGDALDDHAQVPRRGVAIPVEHSMRGFFPQTGLPRQFFEIDLIIYSHGQHLSRWLWQDERQKIVYMKNNAYLFESVIPYAGTVHAAELLSDIETVIKTHVVINDHAAAALAVWVLHTYTYELRDAVAYVAIESPEKRCGKTTLFSVLAAMAYKPFTASNITAAALFRAIDTCRPTLFIDEADTFLAGNGTMRGIINSGNTWRTAYVLRLSSEPQEIQPPAVAGGKRRTRVTTVIVAGARKSSP